MAMHYSRHYMDGDEKVVQILLDASASVNAYSRCPPSHPRTQLCHFRPVDVDQQRTWSFNAAFLSGEDVASMLINREQNLVQRCARLAIGRQGQMKLVARI